MRLIDADELIVEFLRYPMILRHSGDFVAVNLDAVIHEVRRAPTIEAEPVKHGRWANSYDNPVAFEKRDSRCPSESCYCSECKEWLTASDEYSCIGNYCPNCGAKMDLEDSNGNEA